MTVIAYHGLLEQSQHFIPRQSYRGEAWMVIMDVEKWEIYLVTRGLNSRFTAEGFL